MLRKFVDDTKLLRIVDTPHGCAVTQDFNRFETWATRYLRNFKKGKFESLH